MPAPAALALTDPTRPAEYQAPAAGDTTAGLPWHVTSIVIAPDRRVAVINGQAVREGESLDGARVVRIQPTGVKLRQGEQDIDLRLLPIEVKRLTDNGRHTP